MSLACALAAHIEELPGRKVHLTSIVKQDEGYIYIGVANNSLASHTLTHERGSGQAAIVELC